MTEPTQPLTAEQLVEIREDQLALYAESLKWVDPETTAERVFALRDERDVQAAELTRLREQLAAETARREAAEGQLAQVRAALERAKAFLLLARHPDLLGVLDAYSTIVDALAATTPAPAEGEL